MHNHDAIHLKLDYVNALDSKKDLLNSEKNLMLMAKAMHSYASLRKKELKKRVTLGRKAKELASLLKKMQKEMPETRTPSVGKKHVNETIVHAPSATKKQDKGRENIESQLEEIQRKLNDIAG